MLLLRKKVDTKYWLQNVCEVEGIENKDLILNSKLLSDFGDWNLDYLNFIENNQENIKSVTDINLDEYNMKAFCAVGINKENYDLVGFQVSSEYRNQNIGETFLKEIIDYYESLDNKKIKYLQLSTRNPFMKKIVIKLGFVYSYTDKNDFLNNGVEDDIFRYKLKK